MAITSLVLGISVCLATISLVTDGMDAEGFIGVALFGIVSMVLGAINLAQKRSGKGLAIAGVALTALSFLTLAGV